MPKLLESIQDLNFRLGIQNDHFSKWSKMDSDLFLYILSNIR